ncbi:MAG: hypothetical protein ISS66_02085 [Desulfobacteraceae bacterium]|nr:hypothetical protein [Desulfobacteraceae bacterium]
MKGGDVTRPKNAPVTTIRGIVIPVEWDDKGNILKLVISTFDEDEYLIELDKRGKQLMSSIRKELEVTGLVIEGDERKVIKVMRINPNQIKNQSVMVNHFSKTL